MMQIYLNRLFSLSPDMIEKEERSSVSDYDWKLHGVNRESMNFKELKGKVVVLNFWNSWKPSSIAEMYSLQDLYNHYRNNDDIAFVFLTEDDDPEINKYLKDKKYEYPIYRSLSTYPEPFVMNPIPGTYVLDKGGQIAIYKRGVADWNTNTVKEYLDQLIAN
ncbi:TlpA family protein disulfide reductase [Aquimarina brevivitae]|nr:TlpA disulfide reductase family protein [Aquimarina brevivitae]